MIGDWVYCEGQPTPENATIQTIAEDGVWFNGPHYEGAASYDRIFPIPLTPEILEKNGFVKCIGGRSKKSLQLIGDGLYVSWWNDRIVIRYKRVLGHPSAYLNCDCRYVHELQHALRPCKIDKEITI